MEKKNYSTVQVRETKTFLTLWGEGEVFFLFVQIAEIHWMKKHSSHLISQILYTASTLSEMLGLEMDHGDKNDRWGGEGAFRDTCYCSFHFPLVEVNTKPEDVVSFLFLFLSFLHFFFFFFYKRRHTSIVCVCWHVSVGTLVTHCTTLRSFVPRKVDLVRSCNGHWAGFSERRDWSKSATHIRSPSCPNAAIHKIRRCQSLRLYRCVFFAMSSEKAKKVWITGRFAVGQCTASHCRTESNLRLRLFTEMAWKEDVKGQKQEEECRPLQKLLCTS